MLTSKLDNKRTKTSQSDIFKSPKFTQAEHYKLIGK